MSKIKDEAELALQVPVWTLGAASHEIDIQAKRVLLLDKACDKYEKALNARDFIEADALHAEAQEFYKQAEEV